VSGKLPCTAFCGCHAEDCHNDLTKSGVASDADDDDGTWVSVDIDGRE
jgi:hypothetical protein